MQHGSLGYWRKLCPLCCSKLSSSPFDIAYPHPDCCFDRKKERGENRILGWWLSWHTQRFTFLCRFCVCSSNCHKASTWQSSFQHMLLNIHVDQQGKTDQSCCWNTVVVLWGSITRLRCWKNMGKAVLVQKYIQVLNGRQRIQRSFLRSCLAHLVPFTDGIHQSVQYPILTWADGMSFLHWILDCISLFYFFSLMWTSLLELLQFAVLS